MELKNERNGRLETIQLNLCEKLHLSLEFSNEMRINSMRDGMKTTKARMRTYLDSETVKPNVKVTTLRLEIRR